MMIDRLGGINPIDNIPKPSKTQRSNEVVQSDFVSVSAEAKEKAELYHVMETVSLASDVRTERIAEVKEKIKDPNYINKAVIDIVADRMIDVFGI